MSVTRARFDQIASAASATADVGQLLDEGPWTTMQIIVVAMAACSIIIDGFDGQLIGFAVPVLIKEWGVTRGDFALPLAAGLVGMGVGSAAAGSLTADGFLGPADRQGRRVRPAQLAPALIEPALFGSHRGVVRQGGTRVNPSKDPGRQAGSTSAYGPARSPRRGIARIVVRCHT